MREVTLTNGMITLCDDEDYEQLVAYTWRHKVNSNHTEYAYTDLQGMHQMLLCVPEGYVVDHRDGNGLNNQKGNLRAATQQQNRWNSVPPLSRSGFIGVNQIPSGKYQAQIRDKNGRNVYLGLFIDAKEAARAYDKAALEQRGEFAVTNEMVGAL